LVSTATLRSRGYQFALAGLGQKVGPEWIRRGETGQVEFARRLLSSLRPDGIVCVNDHEAAQLIRTFSVIGVRVPDDVAVVSVDDDEWATYLPISLTTLHQPFAELGTTAFKLMLERLADPGMPPREVCLACHLIVRESCGAKRKLELAGN
jgi:DNA-binding LacI/PurR family transcriptional regulator